MLESLFNVTWSQFSGRNDTQEVAVENQDGNHFGELIVRDRLLERVDKNQATDEQIRTAAEATGYSSGPARYRARAEFLFSGIQLAGKHVLDVGCGAGAWAIWAGLNGAASVLGI